LHALRQIVARNGETCSCGQKGCVEAYASASATARRHSFKENKQRMTAKEVFDKLVKKDKTAEQTIDEVTNTATPGAIVFFRSFCVVCSSCTQQLL
jgi:predicted NBD/HSP70 family sugar kinase